ASSRSLLLLLRAASLDPHVGFLAVDEPGAARSCRLAGDAQRARADVVSDDGLSAWGASCDGGDRVELKVARRRIWCGHRCELLLGSYMAPNLPTLPECPARRRRADRSGVRRLSNDRLWVVVRTAANRDRISASDSR